MESVYKPAEDSLLLSKYVGKLTEGKVMDVGTGNGIQGITAAKKQNVIRVVAVDINPLAIKVARQRAQEVSVLNKMDFAITDFFNGFKTASFDWVLFNPPYLPSEGKMDERSWSGGEIGSKEIMRFLSEARDFLKKNGRLLIVYSSRSDVNLKEIERKYSVRLLEELSLFFEKLYCLMLSPFEDLNRIRQ